MKLYQLLPAACLSLAIPLAADALPPFNIIYSSYNGNTAMGTDSMGHDGSPSGPENTAAGHQSMYSDTDGAYNTAFGSGVLYTNVSGGYNTAIGYAAMKESNNGSFNAAVGAGAMLNSGGANYNTAVGFEALHENTVDGNVAVGVQAMRSNTTGAHNTAIGYQALFTNLTGHENTAMGDESMYANTTGQQNMAFGRNALHNNTTGSFNAAMGYSSCWLCRSGGNNVAYGFKTLYNLSSGSGNIAIGASAGFNLNGSNNIDIGNQGINTDSGIIRIGAPTSQVATYIAGINGSKITGAAVYINSSGQLGVLASSERYKMGIAEMAHSTSKLEQLRPVTFHLKNDPDGALQYGLIAEEVDAVYPELVIRDTSGSIQGVRYDELAPMLLNEMRRKASASTVDTQAKEIRELRAAVIALQQQNRTIMSELRAKVEVKTPSARNYINARR